MTANRIYSLSDDAAEAAKAVNSNIPAYFESNKEQLKITVVREPMLEEIPVQVEALRVVEYYAR